LLEISPEGARLGEKTHQDLMRIATDVTPLLSQIATGENHLAIELLRERECVLVRT
jgi:hypothetical protein